jgi:protein-tyrosine phosphatase
MSNYPDPTGRWIDPFNYTPISVEFVLGSIPTTSGDIAALESMGIQSILSLTQTPIQHYDGVANSLSHYNIAVCHCPIVDCSVPSDAIATKALDYLESASQPIYIHCRGGIGRTGTILIAYYVVREGWTLEKAREFVKQRKNYQGNAHAGSQGNTQKPWIDSLYEGKY